jgi:hypothetical protein
MGAILKLTLEDLGCPQGITSIYTDNKCAEGIANDSITLQKSKAMDMRFHWVRDRVRQEQFKVIWKKGSENIADYFTKNHPTSHYRMMRHILVKSPTKEEMNSSKGVLMAALYIRHGQRHRPRTGLPLRGTLEWADRGSKKKNLYLPLVSKEVTE